MKRTLSCVIFLITLMGYLNPINAKEVVKLSKQASYVGEVNASGLPYGEGGLRFTTQKSDVKKLITIVGNFNMLSENVITSITIVGKFNMLSKKQGKVLDAKITLNNDTSLYYLVKECNITLNKRYLLIDNISRENISMIIYTDDGEYAESGVDNVLSYISSKSVYGYGGTLTVAQLTGVLEARSISAEKLCFLLIYDKYDSRLIMPECKKTLLFKTKKYIDTYPLTNILNQLWKYKWTKPTMITCINPKKTRYDWDSWDSVSYDNNTIISYYVPGKYIHPTITYLHPNGDYLSVSITVDRLGDMRIKENSEFESLRLTFDDGSIVETTTNKATNKKEMQVRYPNSDSVFYGSVWFNSPNGNIGKSDRTNLGIKEIEVGNFDLSWHVLPCNGYMYTNNDTIRYIWGLTEEEYLVEQERQRLLEEERKRQEEEMRLHDEERKFHGLMMKYGEEYAIAITANEVKVGMTMEMLNEMTYYTWDRVSMYTNHSGKFEKYKGTPKRTESDALAYAVAASVLSSGYFGSLTGVAAEELAREERSKDIYVELKNGVVTEISQF